MKYVLITFMLHGQGVVISDYPYTSKAECMHDIRFELPNKAKCFINLPQPPQGNGPIGN